MPDLRPRRILHMDLAQGLPDDGLDATRAPLFLVVWWRNRLLGYDQLYRSVTQADLAVRMARLIAPSVGTRLLGARYSTPRPWVTSAAPLDLDAALRVPEPLRALDRQATERSEYQPSVSVAVCTLDRPEELERCLHSIAGATDRPEEVLVVDNAPQTGSTREVLASFPEFRYVREPRPGLSAARNAAAREASGDLLAFVDDDVVVDPGWLRALRSAFADPDVMAVTGLVLPAELETEAQVAFENSFGGFGQGLEPMRYDREFMRASVGHGVPVWKIGAGANMAIRRAAVDLVGEFDERLGAGAAGCSEDSEFWYRLLAEGWACRYEPDSVVFHYHRRTTEALTGQIRDYTRGHVAALFVQFARFGHGGNLRRALLALPRHFVRQGLREVARGGAARVGLTAPRPVNLYRPEVGGYVQGLRYMPLAITPEPPRHKVALRPFLARNPFPRPYTLGFFYREKMRAIHRIAPDLPARDVLEVGGGRSGLARMLYPGAHVTTLDVAEEHAVADVNRDPKVRFVVGDATDLPFGDESFDVVTFFDVLEHIPDDSRAVTEALRVLRPGGFVLVTTPSQRWRFPYFAALAPICPSDEDLIAEWGHVRRGYSPPDLARLFGRRPIKTAGFINAVTALGHDLAWSRLPETVRRSLCGLLSPLTWLGYGLQSASRPGTEIAASWRKPDS